MLDCLLSQTTLLIAIFGYCFYKLVTWNFDYFEKRNVKFVKPIPLFGNLAKVTLQQESLFQLTQRYIRDFDGDKFVGLFEFVTPVYMILDPELIKQITIKEFDHFVNHRIQIDDNIDSLFGRNLVSLNDFKWRAMRSTLSPAFTGSKMRLMFEFLSECLADHTDNILKEAKTTPQVMEMKELFQRFGADVIATCSFGIKINSMKDKNNDFFTHGKRMTDLEGVNGLKFIGFMGFPKLMKLLNVKIIDDKAKKFFQNIVQGNIRYREENKVVRHDMINLLIQMRKNEVYADSDGQFDDVGFATAHETEHTGTEKEAYAKIKWTDDDLTAQCMIFFFAGFDTTSTLMSFVAYELSVNPDIQDRLREEIDEVQQSLKDGVLTYERLQRMNYMDCVISEVLRKWTPAMVLDRICTKAFEMVNTDGTKVTVNVGDGISLPVAAIHRSPKYWSNPDKFDPERFLDANKDNIVPGTYFPFGFGPRNCIGSRFALMMAKAALYNLLLRFHIEKSTKMRYPVKLQQKTVFFQGEDGLWVTLVARQK